MELTGPDELLLGSIPVLVPSLRMLGWELTLAPGVFHYDGYSGGDDDSGNAVPMHRTSSHQRQVYLWGDNYACHQAMTKNNLLLPGHASIKHRNDADTRTCRSHHQANVYLSCGGHNECFSGIAPACKQTWRHLRHTA